MLFAVAACCSVLLASAPLQPQAQTDPLPSWNGTPAKRAILDFVRKTTDQASPEFVSPEQRIATFDQDGTLWVSHPVYAEVMFALDRVVELAPKHPEWKNVQPFKTVLSGDKKAIAALSTKDLEKIVEATHSGMSVEAFQAIVRDWLGKAKHPRFERPYTELGYLPMLELMQYLRARGYKTYIVTGGGQDFVRVYAQQVYGVPPEQVVGSAGVTRFTYDNRGNGVLIKVPKLLLDDDLSGKPEDIHLLIGRRPRAAFGNSTGDRQMLEYTEAGEGARFLALVHHDDPQREYAYGPAGGLPDTKVGTFSEALMTEARTRGWTVISIKNDWKQVFSFESKGVGGP